MLSADDITVNILLTITRHPTTAFTYNTHRLFTHAPSTIPLTHCIFHCRLSVTFLVAINTHVGYTFIFLSHLSLASVQYGSSFLRNELRMSCEVAKQHRMA